MKSRRFVAMISLVTIVSAAAGCGSEASNSGSSQVGDSASRMTIRVAIPSDAIGLAFRDISPEFENLPYDIVWVEMSSQDSVPALTSDAVDLSFFVTPMTATVVQSKAEPQWTAETAPFKVVAAWFNSKHPGNSLAVNDPSIKKVSDLVGKRLVYTHLSLGHYFWLVLKEEFGLEGVDAVEGPRAENRAAYLSGAVDAIIALHREARSYEELGQGSIIDSSSRVIDYYLVTLARPELLDDPATAAIIDDFLRRTDASMTWAEENSAELVAYYLEKGWIEESEVQDFIVYEPRPRVPMDDEFFAMLEQISKVFVDNGVLSVNVDPNIILDRRLEDGVVRK